MNTNKPKDTKRCSQCGFKIRSQNHAKGEHHSVGKDGKYTPSK
jgi:hypothetical protein